MIVFAISLFVIFLIAFAIMHDLKKSVGVVSLYLAVDFMTPWPDVDKLIIIPLFWIPIIFALGITKDYKTAYLVGLVFSFVTGVAFLIIAIYCLGDGTWIRFKNIWTDVFTKAFTTFWGLFMVAIFTILLLLMFYVVYKSKR